MITRCPTASPGHDRRARTARRGSTYVTILGATMLLTVIGLSTVIVARIGLRIGQTSTDWTMTQMLARSGLEHALLEVDEAVAAADQAGTNWRDAFASGDVTGPVVVGAGQFTWTIGDADGDLSDDPADLVTITAIGTAGDAVYRLAVDLEPGSLPNGSPGLSCLEASLYAGGPVDFDGPAVITSDHTIACSTTVTGTLATINASVEAKTISGATFTGTTTEGVAPRDLPGPGVLEYYRRRGTAISVWDLPSWGSYRYLHRVVLSPASNPYGDENPEGIYVIDCKGQDLQVQHARIVGTLVVLNPGKDSRILRKHVNWEAAYPNYPAILVEGDMRCDLLDGPLDEGEAGDSGENKNFNPPSTPYQGATDGADYSDATMRDVAVWGAAFDAAVHDDVYPSAVSGLVYVSGNMTIVAGTPVFEGPVVVGGALTVEPGAGLSLYYDDTYVTDAPPGFRLSLGAPRLVAGSLRRVVD